LLVLFGKHGPIGILFETLFHTSIIFTIYAASAASFLVAFPLMYKSARSAFESVDEILKMLLKLLVLVIGKFFLQLHCRSLFLDWYLGLF
jgi:molybdate transport system permease protein